MNPLDTSPIVASRDHPSSARQLAARRARGEIWSPLPGIFTQLDDSVDVRIAAAQLWAPDLVLCGSAAARITWWLDAPVAHVTLAGGRRKLERPWLRVSQGSVDPDWIMWRDEHKVAAPPMSTMQAALELGGEAIDAALRNRIPLQQLHAALEAMPKVKGKAELRRLLHDSRDEPWSELERTAHQLLRKAGLKRWKTNHRMVLRGRTIYVDITFPGAKIAIELDGWKYHSGRTAFEEDRERQNILVLEGWTVLRFTHQTIDALPEMVLELLRKRGSSN